MIRDKIVKALTKKYESDMETALATIDIYLDNSVGIGEHPQHISEIDKLLSNLEPMGIEILANSSLNVSGDPMCFDLVDGLMVCSRTKLRYLLTDLGLLKRKS